MTKKERQNKSLRKLEAKRARLNAKITELAKNIEDTYLHQGADQLGELKHLLNYQHAQQGDQAMTINLSHHLPTQFAQAGGTWSVLRALGLTAMDTLPVTKTMFARQAMGLVGASQAWQP